MNTIQLLEQSYRTNKGLGSIPIAGKRDAFFLDVEKETEKAVLIQYMGKLHWLPKTAFVLNSISDTAGSNFFNIKPFFKSKLDAL